MSKRVGEHIPIQNPYTMKQGKAIWSGFATEEKQYWWKEKGKAITVHGKIESFTEQGKEILVPKEANLIGLGLRKDVVVNGKTIGPVKSVKIMTRPAATPFEKKLHDRWPVIEINGKIKQFTEKDLRNNLEKS